MENKTIELAKPDEVVTYDKHAIKLYVTNESLKKAVNKIPPVSMMINWTKHNTLKKKLKELDNGMYNLLSWLIIGNNNEISLFKTNNLLHIHGDCKVYHIKTSMNDNIFQKLKIEHGGSYLAYHGSSFGSFHSILRNGLRVMSQTKYQKNGNKYGNGIYHSQTLLHQYCFKGEPYIK